MHLLSHASIHPSRPVYIYMYTNGCMDGWADSRMDGCMTMDGYSLPWLEKEREHRQSGQIWDIGRRGL